MTNGIREIMIRRVRVTENHKPFEIQIGRFVQPAWLAITHATGKNVESFNLVFFANDGSPIDWCQYDTLQIAMDQAHAMVGVERSAWERCNAEITNDNEKIRWEDT